MRTVLTLLIWFAIIELVGVILLAILAFILDNRPRWWREKAPDHPPTDFPPLRFRETPHRGR